MVQRQVQAAANHPPPGISAQEKRLQQLEVGVTEPQQQGRKFEHWFQSVGSQVQDHHSLAEHCPGAATGARVVSNRSSNHRHSGGW